MATTTYRDRAATVLDATLDAGNLGLHTDAARHYLAYWLDEPRKAPKEQVKRWIEYLEGIAREVGRRKAASNGK